MVGLKVLLEKKVLFAKKSLICVAIRQISTTLLGCVRLVHALRKNVKIFVLLATNPF